MNDKVEKLCQRAQVAIAERDWDKAKQAYLLALGLRSDLPDVHYGLATVFFHLNELTSAAHHFREVTRLDPLRAGAFVNLGAVLNLMGQYDEAVESLRRAIRLDPQRVEAYYNLGVVYRRKGLQDLAITAYREAIRLNPRMADAHLNLGNVYLDRQQFRQALQSYEQALQLRPKWEKAMDGINKAKAALSGNALPDAAQAASAPRAGTTPALDRPADPIIHGAFLTNLQQGAAVCEETGKLLQRILDDEIEPVLKELSVVLLHPNGPRSELENCLGTFMTALGRMRTTHEALKGQMTRLEELGAKIPTL